ncbi:MAG: cytochrome c oxidase accessory protein CcoG [Mesorhizobium amorphae]|nr:MAG: cytochrome c oxidase accessory protein CcoG [Mesorhizobium amorphae]
MATLLDTLHDDPRRTVPIEDARPVNSREERADYEARRKIFPSRVEGPFRRLKWALVALFLGIYWVAPWLRWDRGPHAPDQAILLDLARRRFYFFGIEIWPQEFYYVAGLLIMAGLGLFLVTAVAGRAWCGYACPQTVWTDLFIQVERWVEGDRNARIKLDAAPWTFAKIRKRVTVWTLWLLIAIATGGAWVFYFADAPTLLRDLVTLQAAPVAYMTVLTLAATTFWLAGFMREQVCTYMCPWPRIQGAMLDEHSLIMSYNDWRGEPRSRHAKKALAQGLDVGDCVDCSACVAACPMGIDIRDGQQLECITCALCIDACDRVMDKVGKPRGLIAYSTLVDFDHHTATAEAQGRDAARAEQRTVSFKRIARPRVVLYFAVWALIGLGMLAVLANRGSVDATVLHDRAPLFVTLSDGSVRNGYTLKLASRALEERRFTVGLEGLDGATMWVGETTERGVSVSATVPPDAVRDLRIFVARPRDQAESTEFRFTISDAATGETVSRDARFEAGNTP